MSEENQEVQPAPELSPIEQRALDMGWRPKEEFNGEEDDFVDAKEYVARAPLFEKIRTQGKRLEKLELTAQELLKLNSRIEETTYQRALNDLKAKQKEALREGDLEKYAEFNDQIEQVKETKPSPKQVAQQQTAPEFDSWKESNTWYDNDKAMTGFADGLGIDLAKDGLSPREVLKEVEKQVKAKFPEKFKNPNRDRAGVESPRAGGKSSKGEYQLNDQERRIMNTFVQTGVMSKEKYIADLKRAKGEE